MAEKILLQLNNLTYGHGSVEPLFDSVKITLTEGEKIALVGANGSGKTTLFKILGGQEIVEGGTGEMTTDAHTYLVPQIDLTAQQSTEKLYEYIEKKYENWWEVLSEVETLFGTTLEPETTLKQLSGGEFMKINLAIAMKHHPDLLLLDEPTNHLDISSVKTLIDFLNKVETAFIVISHDTFFLDQVAKTVWELDDKKIKTYGGNYSFYKEQKFLHERGIEKRKDVAEVKLQHAMDLAKKDEERREKKAESDKQAFLKGGVDKRIYKTQKNSASASLSGVNRMIKNLKETAEEEIEENTLEDRKLAFIKMKNSADNSKRSIFKIEKSDLMAGTNTLIKAIDLKMTYGDRVVISGNNGSGKSSLIKALVNKNDKNFKFKGGEVYVNPDIVTVYVDQSYSIIKPELGLIANIMNYDKTLTEDKAKEQLGKFQFKTENEMNKPGKLLSGGEMARLMMAMVTSYPIEFLILDEPTNNLDVETVEVLEKALNSYVGGLLVISHNIDFLHNISITQAYKIKDKKLKLMESTPAKKDAYFKELVK